MSGDGPIFNFGANLAPTEVTLPNLERFHFLTDEELSRIGEIRHQLLGDVFFLLVGITFGLLIPAVEEISRFNAPDNPMDVEGLIICFLAAMTLMASLVLFCFWWSRRKAYGDMIAQIRNRKRVAVAPSSARPKQRRAAALD